MAKDVISSKQCPYCGKAHASDDAIKKCRKQRGGKKVVIQKGTK